MVIGDANRCVQILINIISNAIKYTDVGGRIEVSLKAFPENRYQFRCKDNGIGMSPEFVKHICEDYVRAEDSRISKIQGTGLGMSVVKGLTDLMHGDLRIESEEGAGSTFTVELPLPEASPEQREAVLHPAEDEVLSDARLTGRRVLLAEDNALNAEIAMELLKSLGLTIDWAENGQEAVEKFKASEPNAYLAVFMDMQMPVMDGVEATRQIRASGRSDSSILIFAMTANTFAAERNRCMEAGMDGYIAKPVSVKDIRTAMSEHL